MAIKEFLVDASTAASGSTSFPLDGSRSASIRFFVRQGTVQAGSSSLSGAGAGAFYVQNIIPSAGSATTFTFDAAAVASSKITLISVNGTTKTYRAVSGGSEKNGVVLNPAATTTFTFSDAAIANSTITLVSTDDTSKTYKAVSGGTNGTLVSDAATTTFTFSDTAVANSTITLTSALNIFRKYKAVSGDSTNNGVVQSDATIGFGLGSSAEDSATNLELAIEHANGHNGAITVARSTAQLTLTQATVGTAGNTLITTGGSFTNSTSPDPSSNFTGGSDNLVVFNLGSSDEDSATNLELAIEHANGHNGKITVVRSTAQLTLTQATVGVGGNRPITTSGSFTDSTSPDPPSNFTGGDVDAVEFGLGSSAEDSATNLELAIEHANGHNGVITVARSTAQLTLTQATVGTAGNTFITTADNFIGSTDPDPPTNFTGGASGSVSLTVGGSSVSVAYGVSVLATATAIASAINSDAGMSALVTATQGTATGVDDHVVFLKAVKYGIIGNTIGVSSSDAVVTSTDLGGGLSIMPDDGGTSTATVNVYGTVTGRESDRGSLLTSGDPDAGRALTDGIFVFSEDTHSSSLEHFDEITVIWLSLIHI